MTTVQNKKILLVRRPDGLPDDSCWELVEEQVSSPTEGEVLVEVMYLSIDPAMRAWLDANAYFAPMELGHTMRGLGVGRVVESAHPKLAAGDFVTGPLGVQQYALYPARVFRKIDENKAPPSAWIGALGMTGGITAYFGMVDVGDVRAGDTVVVSAAAGAVGSMAGQIARIRGADRVIGIAGGPEKVRFVVDDLGFDACIDYKNEDVYARMDELVPDGQDVYFDNVGGDILDAALDHLADGARIVLCGAISQYNDRTQVQGPTNYIRIAEKNAKMEGYIVSKFGARFGEAEDALAQWLASGEMKVYEHVEKGVENFPATLLKLFSGGHTGKLLLQP